MTRPVHELRWRRGCNQGLSFRVSEERRSVNRIQAQIQVERSNMYYWLRKLKLAIDSSRGVGAQDEGND